MIYFDNAATSLPKPKKVGQAMLLALNTMGNPSRGAHSYALNSLRLIAQTRQAVCDMFNVGNPLNVAFTSGATAALNIAISSVRGHILTTAAEHNSVLRPLYKRGDFTVLPLDGLGRFDINTLKNNVTDKVKAVVMTHASNLTGNVFDIKSVGEICLNKGIKLIVDGSQTAGLIPIDMQKDNISALCLSGHKSLYGISGTGALCIKDDFAVTPLYVGGSGSDSYSTLQPSTMPDLLEAGTPNIVGIAALNEGLSYVNAKKEGVFKNADSLSRYFIKGLLKIKNADRIVFYGDLSAKMRTPVVALNVAGLDSAFVAAFLSEEYNIAVRAGGHCAPLMHKALKTEGLGAVRFSFSHFNTLSEVDTAICAMEHITESY